MTRRSLFALLLAGSVLATAAPSARAEGIALGGIARLELPPGAVGRALPDPELARLREERGAARLLFAGTVTGPDRLRARWEFHRAGRFAEPGPEALDMRALAARLAVPEPGWTFAGWRVPPVFDRDHHALFWAYDVKRESGRRTLSYAAFCTRDGVLLFQRASENVGAFEGDERTFRRLLAGVDVNPGRRWEDFVATDALAVGTLDDLVASRGVPAPEREAGAVPSPRADAPPADAWWKRWFNGSGLGAAIAMIVALRVLLRIASLTRRHRVRPEEIPPPPDGASRPRPIEPE